MRLSQRPLAQPFRERRPRKRRFTIETRLRAEVARWPALFDVENQRVAIAIRDNTNEALPVARRLAFTPEAPPRTAPIDASLLL
jgi:hypothetical protein